MHTEKTNNKLRQDQDSDQLPSCQTHTPESANHKDKGLAQIPTHKEATTEPTAVQATPLSRQHMGKIMALHPRAN
jgi:hypothetical protein